MIKYFRFAMCSVILTLFLTTDGYTQQAGPPLLTVSGDLSDGEVSFDREQLRAIGWETITTHTPFLEGEQEFTGTLMSDLLAHLGIETGTLTAIALNEYSVEIPVSDAAEHSVLVALEHNGKKMRIRDRGPIWIIYPMEGTTPLAMDSERRMVWQLKKLVWSR